LIGLSASHGAFTKEVLTRMSKLNKQPIVFPLSNPATKSECTFADAMEATDNSVIFASGTAFPAYQIPNTTDVRVPGQGNNMYMFPGLGLGAILCRPVSITDRIILRASKALADTLTEDERNKGYLYPELDRIRDVSAKVAVAVCDQALKDGVATKMLNIPSNGLLDYVKSNMWQSDSIEN
jgi:malate dehydrogenase (oxaloacetate-decarboxylating)(NADP+)